ncbi:MAG: carboxymuconolactone decarboxylase family protein [bacterium]
MTGDDALVAAIKADYRSADIDEATRKMLAFVEQVTRRPGDRKESEVAELRKVGFGDEAILDIVHITGYFNHINRVADALGVDLEDFMIQG